MRRIALVFPLLFALSVTTACGDRSASNPNDASSSSSSPSLPLPATGKAPGDLSEFSFREPEDGLLSAEQVEMFVAVKERSAQLAAAGAEESPGSLDLRAARELEKNPKEFQWVADRIREVLRAEMLRGLDAQLAAGDESYLAHLEAMRANATTPADKKRLDELIANERKARTPPSPAEVEPNATSDAAVLANAEIVAAYREQIDAVSSLEEKFSTGRADFDQPLAEELSSELQSTAPDGGL